MPETFDFWEALIQLKAWKKVTRIGWNWHNMYLYHVPANKYPANTEIAKEEFWDNDVPYAAYIAMKNAQWIICMWGATNSDLLESDWMIA